MGVSCYYFSKANNKTKRKFIPNIQSVTFKSEILNKNVTLSVASSSIRTVAKYRSIDDYLLKVKSNKSFKQVLREFGVDFHSNWTLLSKSSPKALKNACSFLGIEDVDDELNYFLTTYLMNYPLAKKKI